MSMEFVDPLSEDSIAQMSLPDARKAYEDRTRNLDGKRLQKVTDNNGLSDDPYIRLRQRLHRRVVELESGYQAPAEKGEVGHHPV